MAAKSLQAPEILGIIGSTIVIKHPDVTEYVRTQVTTPFTANGTALVVADNNGLANTDYAILGEVGDAETEECSVNAAVTRGTAVTLSTGTKFNHELNTPLRKILERGIRIYGAATDGGSGTLIASVDAITSPIADAVMIQWDKAQTVYSLISTDTAYAYYFVKFTDGTTDSAASDYVAAAGLSNQSVSKMVTAGLKAANAEIDNNLITREWLLTVVNDFQDAVEDYTNQLGISKDWSFEVFEDKTSLVIVENKNSYALSGLSSTLKYSDNNKGVLGVRLGNKPLKFIDISTWDNEVMYGKKNTTLTASALIGATTITLSDSSEFSDSGTVYIGSQSITYTANNRSTGVLSGISASGAGSITVALSSGDQVWQGTSPGQPQLYTIFDGNIILNNPPETDFVNYKLKIRGLKRLPRLTSFSESTEIPFAHIAKYFIQAAIEYKKGNDAQGDRAMALFNNYLAIQERKDQVFSGEQLSYYDFEDSGDVPLSRTEHFD